MKLLCFLNVFLYLNISSYGQSENAKAPIDTAVISRWPNLGGCALSNNGKYALYSVFENNINRSTLIITTTSGNRNVKLTDTRNAAFSNDSKCVFFINSGGILCQLNLSNFIITNINYANEYRLIQDGQAEILEYVTIKGRKRNLVVKNLYNQNQKIFESIDEYEWSKDRTKLLFTASYRNAQDFTERTVELFNFSDSTCVRLWECIYEKDSLEVRNLILDNLGERIAFQVKNNSRLDFTSIWYFKTGMKEARQLAHNKTSGLAKDFLLEGIQRFSDDGMRLFIVVKERSTGQRKSNIANVDIWSYSDIKLQSQQLSEKSERNYVSVIIIDENRIIPIQQKNETVKIFNWGEEEIAYITSLPGHYSERNWNASSQPSYFWVSTKSGKRKEMAMKLVDISPNGKYLVLQDLNNKTLFSYSLATDSIKEISKGIVFKIDSNDLDVKGGLKIDYLVEGWLGSGRVLLSDRYDIWSVDLNGNKTPINITNGYGRNNLITFRLPKPGGVSDIVYSSDETIILYAFNKLTKYNGFYKKNLNKNGDPQLLTMGPFNFDRMGLRYYIKAGDSPVYIVRRESTTQSPNYFVTRDFIRYSRISENFPEEKCNWMSSQLITNSEEDKNKIYGILYKPTNFDSSRKYPIVFDCYEERSDELYMFHRPDFSNDRINIPWYVSNGYLVFTPDIKYKIGDPGGSALNAVLSSVKYLSKFPYVDMNKMGIQGHSFGGYEVNYIITHTDVFAAAMSAAGLCDLVSAYGSTALAGGFSLQYFYEVDQFRMGTTPWENAKLFLDNSPIFYSNLVNTPLLMMNNREDGIVPFSQGVEFFTALRRQGKKAWMLQYDGEGHSIVNNFNNVVDYTIRVSQFFDHYLKGKQAPKWMINGVSASRKGLEDGLELE